VTRAADDAVTLDTTGLSLEEVVEHVARLAAAARS
jgi:cytidylate kinase